MSTESTIIIRARKALLEGTDIDVHVPDYIESLIFILMDGFSCSSITDWFSTIRERGIKDIKLSAPEKEIKRKLLGAAYEHTDIICFWEDGHVSRFVRSEQWYNGKGDIVFHENPFDGDYKDLLAVEDNTVEYKQVLLELIELAEKIRYKCFAQIFNTAYRILDGTVTPNFESAPYYVKDLSDDLKRIMFARNMSYVFGGMGSWNDDPEGTAEKMGLEDEYGRLTNELIMSMRKSLFYVTNTCWTKADSQPMPKG